MTAYIHKDEHYKFDSFIWVILFQYTLGREFMLWYTARNGVG